MSGLDNEPVDDNDLDLVNPVLEDGNSAGSNNEGGTVQARRRELWTLLARVSKMK